MLTRYPTIAPTYESGSGWWNTDTVTVTAVGSAVFAGVVVIGGLFLAGYIGNSTTVTATSRQDSDPKYRDERSPLIARL
jgi:hypothetical protein